MHCAYWVEMLILIWLPSAWIRNHSPGGKNRWSQKYILTYICIYLHFYTTSAWWEDNHLEERTDGVRNTQLHTFAYIYIFIHLHDKTLTWEKEQMESEIHIYIHLHIFTFLHNICMIRRHSPGRKNRWSQKYIFTYICIYLHFYTTSAWRHSSRGKNRWSQKYLFTYIFAYINISYKFA